MNASCLLNRRFIRLQAVQHLYAFYVCRKANYDLIVDQIKADFIPDVFADPLADKTQLAQEAQQALELFNSSLSIPQTPLPAFAHTSSRVSTAVSRAVVNYKNEMTRDRRRLEQGLAEVIVTINQACIRIWQLLVEWTHLAKRQNEKSRLLHPHAMTSSVCLADSSLLRRLQDDNKLAKLVQQEAASWGNHMSLVASWYHQLINKDPSIQRCLTDLSTPAQEQKLLVFLIDNIIFDKEVIQSFFNDLDLRWATHKHIVKKLVKKGLTHFTKDSEQELNMDVLGLVDNWEPEQCFYTDLVCKTLQQDKELEELIAQKAKNWSLDRILLLDKTIIKLALCEMLYFTNIPIKVSINEYIDLSKAYSMPKSSQFINGLLDAVAIILQQRSSNEV